MKVWKRNAVIVAVVLFVGAAVYLNWTYQDSADAGKTLGQAELVNGQTADPLLAAAGERSAADRQTCRSLLGELLDGFRNR